MYTYIKIFMSLELDKRSCPKNLANLACWTHWTAQILNYRTLAWAVWARLGLIIDFLTKL